MITILNDLQFLKDKTRRDPDILNTDELKQMCQLIAQKAVKKTIRFAGIAWEEKGCHEADTKRDEKL